MWNTKGNYKRNESKTTCPLCRTEEDTTEHIIVYAKKEIIHIIYWMKMKRAGKNSCNIPIRVIKKTGKN